jgi:hypothetical protein
MVESPIEVETLETEAEQPEAAPIDKEEVELRLFCSEVAAGCKRGGMEPEDTLRQSKELRAWLGTRDPEVARDALEVCARLYAGQTSRYLIQQANIFYDYAVAPPEPEAPPEPVEAEESEKETETVDTAHNENDASQPSGPGGESERPATPLPTPATDRHDSKLRRPQARGRKKAGEAGRSQKNPPS